MNFWNWCTVKSGIFLVAVSSFRLVIFPRFVTIDDSFNYPLRLGKFTQSIRPARLDSEIVVERAICCHSVSNDSFISVTQGIVLQHRFNAPRQFCIGDRTNSCIHGFSNVSSYSCNYIYSFRLMTSRYFDYQMMCWQQCCLNFQVKISF